MSNNSYIQGQKAWDEAFGNFIERARQWRLVAYISLATAFISVAGIVGGPVKPETLNPDNKKPPP